MFIPYKKKNVEPVPVTRSTIQRLSHCPICRNEQRGSAPQKDYIQWYSLTIGYNYSCTSSTRRIFAYTLQGAFPVALFLTDSFEFARFLNRQNQSVQKTPFMYMCPPASTPKGFRRGLGTTKITKYYERTKK